MGKPTLITNKNFKQFAKMVAYPSEPTEHVEAAMERLVPYIEPYLVSVKGLRPQFRSNNSTLVIPFDNEHDAQFYHKSWDRYVANCKRIGKEVKYSHFLLLVEFMKFRQCAEILRAAWFARTFAADIKAGLTPIIAATFKTTIAKTTNLLISKHGFRRDDISLIWGGQDELAKLKNSKEYTPQEIQQILTDAMTGKLPPENAHKILKQINHQLQLKEAGLEDVDPGMRLGSQSLKERQREIDRLQSGRAKGAMFSIKAGGVGLSLQHTDKWTKQKVRRKDNGWAYVEDIPLIPTHPRRVYGTPVYSAIECVQTLGRGHRIDSLSETIQKLVYLEGTIEEHVAALQAKKLRSLAKIVRQKEDWAPYMIDRPAKGQGISHIIADFEDLGAKTEVPGDDSEDELILGEEIEEDEE